MPGFFAWRCPVCSTVATDAKPSGCVVVGRRSEDLRASELFATRRKGAAVARLLRVVAAAASIFGRCLAVPGFHTIGTMPNPSGGVVVGRRFDDLLAPTLLLTHQSSCCCATAASRCCGCGCSECWFSENICALLYGAQLLRVFRPSGASLKLGQLTRRRRCLVGCSTPR